MRVEIGGGKPPFSLWLLGPLFRSNEGSRGDGCCCQHGCERCNRLAAAFADVWQCAPRSRVLLAQLATLLSVLMQRRAGVDVPSPFVQIPVLPCRACQRRLRVPLRCAARFRRLASTAAAAELSICSQRSASSSDGRRYSIINSPGAMHPVIQQTSATVK